MEVVKEFAQAGGFGHIAEKSAEFGRVCLNAERMLKLDGLEAVQQRKLLERVMMSIVDMNSVMQTAISTLMLDEDARKIWKEICDKSE